LFTSLIVKEKIVKLCQENEEQSVATEDNQEDTQASKRQWSFCWWSQIHRIISVMKSIKGI